MVLCMNGFVYEYVWYVMVLCMNGMVGVYDGFAVSQVFCFSLANVCFGYVVILLSNIGHFCVNYIDYITDYIYST